MGQERQGDIIAKSTMMMTMLTAMGHEGQGNNHDDNNRDDYDVFKDDENGSGKTR